MAFKMPAVRLGLFIFLGSLLLAIAVFMIGQKSSLFTSTFTVNAYFKDIQGLRTGATVRLSGIDVGNVSNVEIVNDTTGRVRVEMKLNTDIERFIRTDTKASIQTEGLVGNKVVVLKIGSSNAEEVKNGGTIQAEEPIAFSQIIEETKGIMGYTKDMTKSLADIITKVNSGEGTIGKLLNDDKLYYQAVQLTQRADNSLQGISQELSQVTALFDTLGQGVESIVTRVNSVVTDLDTIVGGVKRGEGFLGQIVSKKSKIDTSIISTMYTIQQTAEYAKLAASRLAENMEALKHNWLFSSYFEQRGYWDTAPYQEEINSSLKDLKEKMKIIDQKIETLQALENNSGNK
jgi:phospholipid/cholesterol/gamma-HCH transport system substrate-binding protein